MITLSNGFEFDFCCAAGALGFDGDGYFWDAPFRWLGLLDPRKFVVVTKTLTLYPRRGNYRPWAPWRSFRLLPGGGTLNALGLPNPGLRAWVDGDRGLFQACCRRGYDVIVSVAPADAGQAEAMCLALNSAGLRGLEINASCPNSDIVYDPVAVVRAAARSTSLPLVAKLGHSQLHLIPDLEPFVEAFTLINAVPWPDVFPGRPSPLAPYGLVGAVSGPPIRDFARDALLKGVGLTHRPIVSCGAIGSVEEALARERLGARAFALGVAFLKPWRPNRIAGAYRGAKGAG